MNLEQLKQSNPTLYAQCIEAGIQQERQRIATALPTHGISKDVVQNIRSGVPLTDGVKAQYHAKMIRQNRAEAQRRTDSAAVIAEVCRLMGVVE